MKFTKEEKSQFIAHYHNGKSVADICTQRGVSKSIFYTWLKSYSAVLSKLEPSITLADVNKMKRQLERLEQKVEVLQAVNCTSSSSSSSPLHDKLQELILLHGQYNVHVLCEALKVDRGTFYNHLLRNKKGQKSYQFRRIELCEQIRQLYDESNQIYGAKKIKAVLATCGIAVSDKMVAELMVEMNIHSIRSGAKKYYLRFNTDKKKDSLKMNFSVKAPI